MIAAGLDRYGVRAMFGNPGSTELPLLESISESFGSVQYHLCLHEDIAMAMAIGYAEVTGQPVAVQVHTAAGLMHALTNLEAAKALKLPIVVLVGQQDARFLAWDPPLGTAIVPIARPYSKWCWQAEQADDLPKVLHRAIATALAPPRGPVVLAIPVNVLSEPCPPPLEPLTEVEPAAPNPSSIEGAAQVLAGAHTPLIIVGDDIAAEGAVDLVVSLAEALGAQVVTERMSARCNFPSSHALFEGLIGRSGHQMEQRLRAADVAVAIGCDSLVPLLYDGSLTNWPVSLVVLTSDPLQAAKGPPSSATVLGDLLTALTLLTDRVVDVRSPASAGAAPSRTEYTPQSTGPELTLAKAIAVLNKHLPPDTFMVEEAVSGKYSLSAHYAFDPPRQLLGAKTGGLGFGLGACIGAAIAVDGDCPVVGVIGDGSMLYYPQALWTAMHAGVDVIIVALNNGGYAVLYENLKLFGIDSSIMGHYFDISTPAVDFGALGGAFGIPVETVTRMEDLGRAIDRSIARGGSTLIEARLAKESGDADHAPGGRLS